MEQSGTEETHLSAEKKVPVVEMFGPTIEGEGALIGTQTFFIRFGLCDYKCKKCDSMHAVDPKMVKALADWSTPTEIAQSLLRFRKQSDHEHINNVTFSGGNPAIHELAPLVHELHHHGIRVFVETQGTKCPDWMYNADHIVCSPKSPGMGEKFDMWVFKEFMHKYCAAGVPMSVKIVIFSAVDIEFAAGVADILSREFTGYPSFHLNRDFYLSQGNPYPPIFKLEDNGNVSQRLMEVEGVPTEHSLVSDMDDHKKKEISHKKALVDSLLNSYNILSAEVMRDPRISFARFLPQLHVLVYGNETGR